jgi:hypothetical protein
LKVALASEGWNASSFGSPHYTLPNVIESTDRNKGKNEYVILRLRSAVMIVVDAPLTDVVPLGGDVRRFS